MSSPETTGGTSGLRSQRKEGLLFELLLRLEGKLAGGGF